MVSRRHLLAFTCGIVLALVAAAPALVAKQYRADRYDVRLVIEPGGSMVVTESIHFAFGRDSFTYVSRGLPTRRTDGLTILSASMDGRPLSPGDGPGEVEVRREKDGVRRIVWHFEKTTGRVHVFTLTYRVTGVVWQDAAADVLEWHALPTNHEYEIALATLTIVWPAQSRLAEPVTVEPATVPAHSDATTARFARADLAKNASWLVRARFEPRSVASLPPDWQRRQAKARQELPLFLGLAALVLAGGIGGFVVFGINQRPPVPRDKHARQPAPPSDLPLILGAAIAQDGRTNWNVAMAAILDMARRGVIRVDEIEGGLLQRRDFAIVPVRGSAPTQPAERVLYDLLFTDTSGARAQVKVSELSEVFGSASRWKRFTNAVRDELRRAGLLDEARAQTRNRATVAAVAVIGLGIVGLIAAVPFVKEHGGATLMIGAALMVVGLTGVGVAQSLPTLTDEALRHAGLWQAHGRHLKDLSQADQASTGTPDLFDRLLPYAAAFGVAAAWAKALEKRGVAAGPAWLRMLSHEGGPADHMAATVALLHLGHSEGHAIDHSGAGAGSPGGAAGGGSSSAG